MPDLQDLVDPAELIDVVRQLDFPRFQLGALFPDDIRNAIDYSYISGAAETVRAAPYRAYDAEAPIGSRPGLQRTVGALPPISQKIILTEGDRLMLEGLFSGNNSQQDRLIQAIFNDAARQVRSVQARVELARGDALTDGIVTINENGQQFTVDFGVPVAHKETAAVVWSNPTADIIGEITAWVETYVDTNGVPPARAFTSTSVIGAMLRNDDIRASLALPSRTELNAFLTASDLPAVEPYDVQVETSAGVKTRVLPADRFVMVPGEGDGFLGRTQYGTTAEAMELASEGLIDSEAAPGVVAVTWKTKDPVHIWTKGAAIALPLITNPNLLFTADVL